MIKRDLYYDRIPTKSLREDVRYLGLVLGKVIKDQEGEVFFKLVEKIRKLSKTNKFNSNSDKSKTLEKEIGIRELDLLYYDVFDMDEKAWNKMSPKMQKKYEKDLTRFYQIFTGKKKRPTTVTSFSDIESLPYHNLYRCKNQEYFKDLVVQKNDALFV